MSTAPQLSEVIGHLQNILNEKGDLPVRLISAGGRVDNYDGWRRTMAFKGDCVTFGLFCELGQRPGLRQITDAAREKQRAAKRAALSAAERVPGDRPLFAYTHSRGLAILRADCAPTFSVTYDGVFRFADEDERLVITEVACDRPAVVCLGDSRFVAREEPSLLASTPNRYVMGFGDHFGIPHCDLKVVGLSRGARITVTYEAWPEREIARLKEESASPWGGPAAPTVTFGRHYLNSKTGRAAAIFSEVAARAAHNPKASPEDLSKALGYPVSDVVAVLETAKKPAGV